MKKIILQNGLRSGIGILAVNLILWRAIGANMPFSMAETVGWTLILLSCSFVFIGIQQYRDHANNGQLSLPGALKVGSLISLFPALGIFIFEVILWTVSGQEYMDYYLASAQSTMSPADFEKMSQEISANPIFMNPFFQAAVMFATVFITGLAIAVVAGIILRKK